MLFRAAKFMLPLAVATLILTWSGTCQAGFVSNLKLAEIETVQVAKANQSKQADVLKKNKNLKVKPVEKEQVQVKISGLYEMSYSKTN